MACYAHMHKMRTAATVCLLLAAFACNKEASHFSRRPGDPIVFSAGSASQAVTRIAYESGTGNGHLWWQDGDIVEICCINDEETKQVSYSASPSSGDATAPILLPAGSDLLTWGTGAHSFYAMYPSPQMDGAEDFALDADEVTFVMPWTQTPAGHTETTASDATTTTMNPNMVFAPLVASTQIANPSEGEDAVPLRFKAAFTAFEFVVKVAGADGELRLTDFTLSSAETTIAAASVTATINGTGSDVALSSPQITEGKKSITVPLGTASAPFVLSGNNTLVFTVLTLAFEDVHKVTVRFNTTTGYRQLALKYNTTYFAANSATLIADGKADEDGWMIFPKGGKTTMSGFNVPGYFYIAYGEMTLIGGAPYQPGNPGTNWDLVPLDMSMDQVIVDGQSYYSHDVDTAWDFLLETVHYGEAEDPGQTIVPITPDEPWKRKW